MQLNRRKAGTKDWIKLMQTPNDTIFTDKNVERGAVYEYEIIAQDQSGLVSEESKRITVKVIPKQRLDSIGQWDLTYSKLDKAVKLTWEYPMQDGLYFVIYKKNKEGELTAIDFVENAKLYIDTAIKTGNTQSYAIKPVLRKGAEGKISDIKNVLITD